MKNKTLKSYSELFNIQNALLLADIFESFRELRLKIYKLDPVHYLTSPSLTWDAMLKVTKVELDPVTDYEMYLMIKHGIRGGIYQSIRSKLDILNVKNIRVKLNGLSLYYPDKLKNLDINDGIYRIMYQSYQD